MFIFKKPSKNVTTAPARKPKPIDTERTENGTTRYSDIAAGRKNIHVYNTTPIQKLLDIFELCGQVLDFLPMRDVVHLTRVCRAFKENIEGAPLLQAKLFLAPDRTLKKVAVSLQGTLLAGHKAEQQIAAAIASNKASEATGNRERLKTGEISLYTPHPFLRMDRLSDRYTRMGIVKYAGICLETRHANLRPAASFRDLSTAISIPANSSFYKMFVSQPPALKVIISMPCRSDHGTQQFLQRPIKVCNSSGVTMGDVLQTIRDACDLDNLPPLMKRADVFFLGGFAANDAARTMVEEAGELSSQDDLTRWLSKGDRYVLKEDGFAFW